MDSGAAGHVTIEGMFSRVKLERKTAPEKVVAANGEQSRDLGDKTTPLETHEGSSHVQKLRVLSNLYLSARGCPSWKHCRAG